MKKIIITAAAALIAATAGASPMAYAKVAAAVHPVVADAFTGAQLAASLINDKGQSVGTARALETPKGLMIDFNFANLAPGWHAIHIHGVGKCDDHADHFKASGGHFAKEGEEHGYLNEKGPHSGDMPNFWVNAEGEAKFQVYDAGLKASDLNDADGSAFIIHAKPDDYKTPPAGDAGERLACGVIGKM